MANLWAVAERLVGEEVAVVEERDFWLARNWEGREVAGGLKKLKDETDVHRRARSVKFIFLSETRPLN